MKKIILITFFCILASSIVRAQCDVEIETKLLKDGTKYITCVDEGIHSEDDFQNGIRTVDVSTGYLSEKKVYMLKTLVTVKDKRNITANRLKLEFAENIKPIMLTGPVISSPQVFKSGLQFQEATFHIDENVVNALRSRKLKSVVLYDTTQKKKLEIELRRPDILIKQLLCLRQYSQN